MEEDGKIGQGVEGVRNVRFRMGGGLWEKD